MSFKKFFNKHWLLIAMIAVVLSTPQLLWAEGNIGFSYSRAVDDVSLGVHGDYEKQVGPVDLSAEGQMQTGDLYLGNVDLSATWKRLRIASDNKLQGATLAGIGRQNTMTGSLVFPFLEKYEITVGVFGQNGNPFDPVYELADSSDPDSAELKDAGIPIPEGNLWGISVTGAFDVKQFEIDGKALIDPNNITHQLKVGVGTGGDLFGGLGWSAKANIAAQSHKTDDEGVVAFQTDTIIGIDYKF